jgi:hypothetical protein
LDYRPRFGQVDCKKQGRGRAETRRRASHIIHARSECRWVKPKLVCQVAFVEWTDAGHLRHCTFVAMRDDKNPAQVVRETQNLTELACLFRAADPRLFRVRLLLLLILLLAAAYCEAAPLLPEEAKDHIGENASVRPC